MMRATPHPTFIQVQPTQRGSRRARRQGLARIGAAQDRPAGNLHASDAELIGPAVTTLYRTMSYGKKPEGRDTLENQQLASASGRLFIGGCHSWRTDGPVVAAMFPQFATKPAAKD